MKHNKNKELKRITEDKHFPLYHFIKGVELAKRTVEQGVSV